MSDIIKNYSKKKKMRRKEPFFFIVSREDEGEVDSGRVMNAGKRQQLLRLGIIKGVLRDITGFRFGGEDHKKHIDLSRE